MSVRRAWLRDLAAVADIIAAGAVVVSLIYVGRELHANTAATQAATYQQVIQNSDEYLLAIATDPSLAGIVRRAHEPDSLNADEKLRYFYLQRSFWRNMENAFVQHGKGVLADADWATYHHLLCSAVHDPSWPYQEPSLSPAFLKVVEACKGG